MSISDTKRYDREYVIHSWSVQSALDPMVITKTQGVYMWDENGKRYLDMTSQLMNQNIGHQHPKVVEAIQKQAAKVCFVAPGVAYESRSFLGKALAEITPGDLKKFFFTLAGADANENAVKMARAYTKKWKIVTRYRSYHGATYGAIAGRTAYLSEPYVGTNDKGILVAASQEALHDFIRRGHEAGEPG